MNSISGGRTSAERAPRTCAGALLPEAAYRPVIEATLEELAGWIEECVGVGRAAVA